MPLDVLRATANMVASYYMHHKHVAELTSLHTPPHSQDTSSLVQLKTRRASAASKEDPGPTILSVSCYTF